MYKSLSYFSLILLVLIYPSYMFSQTSGYKILGSIKIGGTADWDYLSVLGSAHELFVSHYSELDIIDLNNNNLVGKIAGLKDVHGVAFATEFNKGFISDGKHNSIVTFNLKTFKVIKRIRSTGYDPDAIIYDPFSKRIFAFNGHSTNATAIDAKTNMVVGKVNLSGGPEFGVSDFKGHIYSNIEDKSEINVINTKTLRVIKTWKIPPCKQPSAMAIDRENNRLFVGARNKTFAVINTLSGKVIVTFPIGSGADAGRFDPETRLIFFSTKDGNMSVFKEETPDKYKFIESIKTLPHAKTMALDKSNHLVYTSAMLNGSGSGKTFGVLVLGRK